jgi:hypothetical protein
VRSLYSDIFTTLTNATFSIPSTTVRKPFDESDKVYPLIVLEEIVNKPNGHATVTGEAQTVLSYQLTIHTQTSVDDHNAVLSRYDAGRLLVGEVNDVLDAAYKFTRRTMTTKAITTDVFECILRGDCVLDSLGYSYRP